MDKIKKTKMSTFANLLECRPIAVEGNAVVLQFHDRAAGHMDRICNDVNKSFVENVLRELTGKPYVIKCLVGGKEEPVALDNETTDDSPQTAKPETKPKPDPGSAVIARQRSSSVEAASDEDIPPLPTEKDPAPAHIIADEPASKPKEPEAAEDMVATIAGLFDATVKETKERKNEG